MQQLNTLVSDFRTDWIPIFKGETVFLMLFLIYINDLAWKWKKQILVSTERSICAQLHSGTFWYIVNWHKQVCSVIMNEINFIFLCPQHDEFRHAFLKTICFTMIYFA